MEACGSLSKDCRSVYTIPHNSLQENIKRQPDKTMSMSVKQGRQCAAMNLPSYLPPNSSGRSGLKRRVASHKGMQAWSEAEADSFPSILITLAASNHKLP
jgi:hypothetical protein